MTRPATRTTANVIGVTFSSWEPTTESALCAAEKSPMEMSSPTDPRSSTRADGEGRPIAAATWGASSSPDAETRRSGAAASNDGVRPSRRAEASTPRRRRAARERRSVQRGDLRRPAEVLESDVLPVPRPFARRNSSPLMSLKRRAPRGPSQFTVCLVGFPRSSSGRSGGVPSREIGPPFHLDDAMMRDGMSAAEA